MAPDIAFDPDTFIQPSHGNTSPSEEKSPPASAFFPNIDDYLTVDPVRYTSATEQAAEWDHMWTRAWIVAGRESDAATPGSWFRFEIGRESFVIIRGQDHRLRALYNICQHRGNRLVDKDFGVARAFTCPYHSWQYDLTGKNIRVTDQQTFKPKALCGNLDLPEVRCDVFGGFVFINMDPAAKPLEEYIGKLAEILAPYRLEEMNVVKDVTVDINSNWKVCLHAFLESYHVHITHPGAITFSNDIFIQNDFYENGHSRGITELGDMTPRRDPSAKISHVQARVLADAGVDPDSYQGGNKSVRQAVQEAKRKPGNPYQFDYSNFSDNQLTDTWVVTIFPNTLMTVHPEGVLFMRFFPDPKDPAKHVYHLMTLAARIAPGANVPWYMGVEPGTDLSGAQRPERRKVQPEESSVGPVIAEDIRNLEESQRGMLSRALKTIRLSQQEQRIQYFFAEMDRYLRACR